MATGTVTAHNVLILAGHSPIRSFVRIVKAKALDGLRLDEASLIQEWRAANARVRELESAEVAAAENSELAALPGEVSHLADAQLRDPRVQSSFGLLPYSWAMVDLERVIAWQSYIDLDFVTNLRSDLPTTPTLEQLMRFAAGRAREPPPLQVAARGGNKFHISSRSSDLRVIETVSLDAANFQGYEPHGHAHTILAAFFGYSVNIMSAVRLQNRLLLTNGTHRAYAMLAAGITRAPCIVQHASGKEDLDLVGTHNGSRAFDWYFTAKRPPLVRDFFDERLIKVVPARSELHLLSVQLTFEHSVIPSP